MGRDKATVEVSGRSMLDTIIEVVAEVGETLVVGAATAPEGVACVPDLRSGRQGPLAGLETALVWASGREVALVAVDQPFLRAETIERLLHEPGDAVLPSADAWPQVTCAVYRAHCLSPAAAVLDSGEGSLLAILDRVDTRIIEAGTWREWGEDGRSWFSVDTPDRLKEGLEKYA